MLEYSCWNQRGYHPDWSSHAIDFVCPCGRAECNLSRTLCIYGIFICHYVHALYPFASPSRGCLTSPRFGSGRAAQKRDKERALAMLERAVWHCELTSCVSFDCEILNLWISSVYVEYVCLPTCIQYGTACAFAKSLVLVPSLSLLPKTTLICLVKMVFWFTIIDFN